MTVGRGNAPEDNLVNGYEPGAGTLALGAATWAGSQEPGAHSLCPNCQTQSHYWKLSSNHPTQLQTIFEKPNI